MSRLRVSDVQLTPASERDRRDGLLGFIRLRVGAFLLDGLALRRCMNGTLALAWPARTDSWGVRHPIVQPVDAETRRRIEDAVFKALRLSRRGPFPATPRRRAGFSPTITTGGAVAARAPQHPVTPNPRRYL